MKFRAPSRRCVFTLQLKGKGRAAGLKAVSSWLQTPETEVDALYRCLHWAVYPSNSHENPQRPSVPVLYPALTNAALPTNTISLTHTKHLIHTNVRSAPSVRWQLPLHPSVRRWKTCERKRKKGSHKVYCQKRLQVFSGINWRQLDLGVNNWITELHSRSITVTVDKWQQENTDTTQYKSSNVNSLMKVIMLNV